MIGCSAHKGSAGQGLRSKAAANGAQIVPRSSHFLSQIYAQGGEGRGGPGRGARREGLGLGAGGAELCAHVVYWGSSLHSLLCV